MRNSLTVAFGATAIALLAGIPAAYSFSRFGKMPLLYGVIVTYMFDLALYSANVGKTRQAASHYSNPELDKLLDSFYQTSDEAEQHKIMDQVQMIVGRDLPYVAVFNNPLWYEYSTKRFTGWFNADNPVARPVVYGGVPERVLHLLALRPVAN